MTAEQWRPIPGFPDYFVSDVGRVLSHKQGGPRFLRGKLDRHGYRTVNLQRPGTSPSTKLVHRLMAMAFYGPRGTETHARHLDGDRLNNQLSNLAWGSPSDNMQDRLRHGRYSNAMKQECPAGHAYSPENTYAEGTRRHCRKCRTNRQRVYRARRALATANIKAAA